MTHTATRGCFVLWQDFLQTHWDVTVWFSSGELENWLGCHAMSAWDLWRVRNDLLWQFDMTMPLATSINALMPGPCLEFLTVFLDIYIWPRHNILSLSQIGFQVHSWMGIVLCGTLMHILLRTLELLGLPWPIISPRSWPIFIICIVLQVTMYSLTFPS